MYHSTETYLPIAFSEVTGTIKLVASHSQNASWKTIAPIIGDVVVSPWNLFIGGLLILHLDFWMAVTASILGYLILGLIFWGYGSLGAFQNAQTSELIEPVFGRWATAYLFSILLALGQIGWFAIVTQIGGTSFAELLGLDSAWGIIMYALIMFCIAAMNLHHMALLKLLIIGSSIGLLGYIAIIHLPNLSWELLSEPVREQRSLIWGIAVVVSSLISFASVTPDFYSQMKKQSDHIRATIIGLIIPGIGITVLGMLVFSTAPSLGINALIGVGSFALFGHLFNIITNTDASIAIYTPGNRLRYLTGFPFVHSVAIATMIGTLIALADILRQIELWLTVLAAWFPTIIILTVLHSFAPIRGISERVRQMSMIGLAGIAGLLMVLIDHSIMIWTVSGFSLIGYGVIWVLGRISISDSKE